MLFKFTMFIRGRKKWQLSTYCIKLDQRTQPLSTTILEDFVTDCDNDVRHFSNYNHYSNSSMWNPDKHSISSSKRDPATISFAAGEILHSHRSPQAAGFLRRQSLHIQIPLTVQIRLLCKLVERNHFQVCRLLKKNVLWFLLILIVLKQKINRFFT